MRKFFIAVCLFTTVLGVYYFINPKAKNDYDHYFYLVKSFLSLRVNLTENAEFYHDTVRKGGKTYAPFGPAPALFLMPSVLLSKPFTQQEVSIILGAINIALIFLLLSYFTSLKKAFLLVLFLAFGTVYFWSSIIGTVWNFAHLSAIFFLTLSLLLHFNKKDGLSGIFFALAILSRYPVIGGGLFFFFQLLRERSRLIKFLLGLSLVLIPTQLTYNWLRFQNLFEMGYVEIYQRYVNSGFSLSPVSFYKPFGYMDIRNIPLHLIVFLLYPPQINLITNLIKPSAYGMGILFTSPLLLWALIPNFKHQLQKHLFLGVLGIAFFDFMHYMQGWVQFGYRFALDFMVFLILILAIKSKPKGWVLILLIIWSITVCTWGVVYDLKFGLL